MSNVKKLGYVDSWRFWAVLIVIIGHLFQVKNSTSPVNAGIGVYIFFLLAGLLLVKVALLNYRKVDHFLLWVFMRVEFLELCLHCLFISLFVLFWGNSK